MGEQRILTIKEKALQINLDQKKYGSFAEIGAGQEVAANFFKAGGASGTVAKTMSAYDMEFSDAIYGKTGRYVCEERLQRMLDREFDLLQTRLESRASDTCFFAFANTVETLNFSRTNNGHGWIGVKYQIRPMAEPNECIIHVVLNDQDAARQQEALGMIGVNLIHSCFYVKNPGAFLEAIVDNLWRDRVEIDMFRIEGPDFEHIDNRLMALKLVKKRLTRLAMFGPDGRVLQPSEALYKKNVMILRGRFRPVTHVNVDMLFCGHKRFKKEKDVTKERIMVLSELTLKNLEQDGSIDDKDFLSRVDLLCSLGQNVVISNYTEYYRLVRHVSRITKNNKIGIVLGIYSLHSVFDEKYYSNLKGGILESFGILFGRNVKFYVYPSINKETGETYELKDMELPPHQKHLLKYLIETNKLEGVTGVNNDNLHILSDDVLNMIKSGEEGWERMMPARAAKEIKEKQLFDYSEYVWRPT